jgi:NDP-sugar pyrophosphorylase family protein
MILAAGRGERLRPLTDDKPKPLVRVAGRCLIDYAIDTCCEAGITDIIVNLHHFGDQIRDHVGDGSDRGVHIFYSEEPTLQGSGGGIREARDLLGSSTFVTLNSDTIIDIDLGVVLSAHRRSAAAATLVLRKDRQMEKFGLIQLEADNRIGAFLSTQREGFAAPLEPYMYTGVQILEPEIFAYMPESPTRRCSGQACRCSDSHLTGAGSPSGLPQSSKSPKIDWHRKARLPATQRAILGELSSGRTPGDGPITASIQSGDKQWELPSSRRAT